MQKTVNSQTQRPYTISMIERYMRDVHFALDPNKSSKKQVSVQSKTYFLIIWKSSRFWGVVVQAIKDAKVLRTTFLATAMQALELIKELENKFSIIRAKMRLQLFVPNDQGPKLSDKLEEWGSVIERSDGSNAMFKVVSCCALFIWW